MEVSIVAVGINDDFTNDDFWRAHRLVARTTAFDFGLVKKDILSVDWSSVLTRHRAILYWRFQVGVYFYGRFAKRRVRLNRTCRQYLNRKDGEKFTIIHQGGLAW